MKYFLLCSEKKRKKWLLWYNWFFFYYWLQGHNIILISNHQTEADPAVISLLLETTNPHIAENMVNWSFVSLFYSTKKTSAFLIAGITKLYIMCYRSMLLEIGLWPIRFASHLALEGACEILRYVLWCYGFVSLLND